MEHQHGKITFRIIVGAICIAAIWAIYGLVMFLLPFDPQTKGVWGDSFGALSSLFSGLAFMGLLITVFLQMQEISRLAAEQRESATLLDQQVKTLKLTAKLNYLNDAIAFQRQLLKDYPDNGSWGSGLWYTQAKGRLEDLMTQREQLINELNC